MRVMQQPERARACGSGAKSSADRRPVDPPPVVELRIFSGEGPDREDITFAYEANFFLFATLEAARPIARGRLPQTIASPIPVLTGMPVSGMAYLDRPAEAGYFIFPDLSVRHEGRYQLSFSLYEETKNDVDKDPDSMERKQQHFGGPGAADSSFDWRLEIKSDPFLVYSAKKFPGLAESTVLSRTISEQGCRVRIRRDVRMRRRDPAKDNAFENPADEEYRRGRTAEADPYSDHRSRAGSGSPNGSPVRGGFDGSQHGSQNGEFSGPSYPGQPPRSNLDFGSQYQAGPSFQAPHSFAQPPPPPPPAHAYPPPQNYHSSAPAQYRSHAQPTPPASYPSYDRQYPQTAYPSNPPREQAPYEQDPRRASTGYTPAPALLYPSVAVDPMHERLYPRASVPEVSIAPLKFDPVTSATGRPRFPPLVASPIIEKEPERAPYLAAAPEPRNGKRDFGSTFPGSSIAVDSKLSNHMRPDLLAASATDDDEYFVPERLIYKRADDRRIQRENLPFSS